MEKTNPYFSIVIPTYNRGYLLQKTIQSILSQSYSAYEVIVVDDGGTDDTKAIVESFADNRINYYWKANGERGAARNFGWTKAKGQYVSFLDSDDLVYGHHLQTAFQFLTNHPEVACFAQAYEIKDSQTGRLIKKAYQSKDALINEELLKGNFLSCFGVFIKTEIVSEIKFQEERRFAGTEDWLLWLQLSARFSFYYNNSVTGALLEHSGRSVLHFNKESLLFRAYFLKGMLENDHFFLKKYGQAAIQKIFAHMLSYASLHLAMNHLKKEAFKYLVKSLYLDPSSFLERRTFAIGKKLLIG